MIAYTPVLFDLAPPILNSSNQGLLSTFSKAVLLVLSPSGHIYPPAVSGPGVKVPIAEVQEAILGETWRELRDKYGGLVKPDIVFFGEANGSMEREYRSSCVNN